MICLSAVFSLGEMFDIACECIAKSSMEIPVVNSFFLSCIKPRWVLRRTVFYALLLGNLSFQHSIGRCCQFIGYS